MGCSLQGVAWGIPAGSARHARLGAITMESLTMPLVERPEQPIKNS